MSEHAEHIAKLIADLPPPSQEEKAFLKKALAPAVTAIAAERADADRLERSAA